MTIKDIFNRELTRNTIPESNLSKKVDFRLGKVADEFSYALGKHFVEKEDSFFMKTLILKDMKYIDRFTLRYTRENRLMAVMYDMQYESVVKINMKKFREIGSCSFIVESKGKYRRHHPVWVCKYFEGKDKDRQRCLKALKNPLIIDRIDSLDLKNVKVTHTEGSDEFFIHAESMLGSATWIFIPPVVHVITPHEDECLRFLEVFEMIAKAVTYTST